MKRFVSSLIAFILISGILPFSIPVDAAEHPSDWAVNEVFSAREIGLFTDKTSVDYQKNITREEFCELVVKLYTKLSGVSPEVGEDIFVDTDNTEILKAYGLGIVKGVSATEFAPNNPITRQEICVMLARCIDIAIKNSDISSYEKTEFVDGSKVANWALSSVNYAYDKGIIKGVGEKEINPLGNTTCEQAILLAYRTYKNKGNFVPMDIDNSYTPNIENIATDIDSNISFINNIVLIYFKDNATETEKQKVVESINGTVVGELPTVNQYQVQIESKSLQELEAVCTKLEESKIVILATYDEVYFSPGDSIVTPNDPWSEGIIKDFLKDEYQKVKWNEEKPNENNWWVEAVQLPSAWAYKDEFSPIKVGIIDTGFDIDHEDFGDRIKFPSNAYKKTNDSAKHGTHVAGIIGAVQDNKKGITGVVWTPKPEDLELICVDWKPSKKQEKNGEDWTTTNMIAEGVIDSVKSGAKVINLSLGCCGSKLENHSDTLSKDEIAKMAEQPSLIMGNLLSDGYDFVIVQSAGNGVLENALVGEIGVDAIYNGWFCSITTENCVDEYKHIAQDIVDRIIVVGAYANTSNGFVQTKFSNGGSRVDIVAPGQDIYSCLPNDSYGNDSGTSMAAPIVTGVASLVWSIDPTFTGAEVKSIVCDVRSTSEPIPDNSKSPNTTGDFRGVNAYKAVKFALTQSRKNKQKLDALLGVYKGSYIASQGETALTLTVYNDSVNYKAHFDFESLPGRNNAEDGEYYMDVSYDLESDTYLFTATENDWIEKPATYVTLDLEGTLKYGVLSGETPTRFKVIKVQQYTRPEVYLDKLVGTYKGTYEPSQGTAGITLDIYKEGDEYKATCEFYNLPGQSNTKEGSFTYNVSYSELDGYFLLEGDKWIERPGWYSMLDLQGYLGENIFSGEAPTPFKVERVSGIKASKTITEAMDAYFETVIKGHADLELSENMITDKVRETMLKAAPEEAWYNLPFSLHDGEKVDIDEIFISYIALYREYVWGDYRYNVGMDYKISYEITSQTQLTQDEIIALDERLSSISAIYGENLDSDYVKEQSKYTYFSPVIRKGSLEDAYKITVKYTATGSKKDWIREGEYIAIKTDGNWYITRNGVYNIFWDNTITTGMSGAWHP